MPMVEIDERTSRTLEFAARMAGVTPGQVVARLVDEASFAPVAEPLHASDSDVRPDGRVRIYADYEGQRTHAMYDPVTKRVDIVSGALDGTSYKTPTGAA